MQNIELSKVVIKDGFWKQKQDIVRETTIWSVYNRFKETHRFDALKCTWKEGDPNEPHIFWDSDVAKWLEAASYLLQFERNAELEDIIEDAVNNIAKNADENGYFNSHFLVNHKDARFTNRGCHELYCAGHLMEAAVAYRKATGRDKFLNVMCKYADYIERVFKINQSANFTTPGHPEIELALVKLYEKRYLELSKFFIDMYGNNEKDKINLPNWQSDKAPLRNIRTAEGHSVRALYLLCGMADIARIYKDAELEKACLCCYENIVNKRMYITGGVGSTVIGEAFCKDYYLPNRTAYAETCAAISLAMFAGHMQKINSYSTYADTVERVMYNGMLSALSLDGKAFFYENPLEIDIDVNSATPERHAVTQRQEVFGCSCCPPNVLRFIASVGDYIYGYDDETVFVNQYMTSEMLYGDTELVQQTSYPNDGNVTVKCKTDKKYLALRIPEWCHCYDIDRPYFLKDGYAYIQTEGNAEIHISFSMPVEIMRSNTGVHGNNGKVAIMRGPIVYCCEGIDNVNNISGIKIDINADMSVEKSDFGVPCIKAHGVKISGSDKLYSNVPLTEEEIEICLIPYFAFANRGESSMQVWMMYK